VGPASFPPGCQRQAHLLPRPPAYALMHTDFNPLNILLGPDRTWIIDWAWPTRGAALIDAACFLIRNDDGRPQRQPGRSTRLHVPWLAACPSRRHRRLCSRQRQAVQRDRL
jgi:streptomycin 6-kinase